MSNSDIFDWDDLNDYVKIRTAYPETYKREFDNFPRPDLSRMQIANALKSTNRFGRHAPYDGHIVEIEHLPYFVNASNIYDYDVKHKFVIIKEPNKLEQRDFWRVAWSSNAQKIIMLSKSHDHVYYATPGQVCPAFSTKMLTEKHFDGYIRRTFTQLDPYAAEKENVHNPDTRTIEHFEFTGWRDNLPDTPTLFLKFYYHSMVCCKTGGTTIVHCPDGITRSGTFIAYDLLVKEFAKGGPINIKEIIEYLRFQRLQMVSTCDHYIFLHNVLLQHVLFRNVSVKKNELQHIKCNDVLVTWLKSQYEALETFKVDLKKEDSYTLGLDTANAHLNRRSSTLPLDNYIPLIVYPLDSITKVYINASFIRRNSLADRMFIATQLPLKHTRHTFYQMVHQQEAHLIFTFQSVYPSEKFWPENDCGLNYDGTLVEHLGVHEAGEDLFSYEYKIDYDKRVVEGYHVIVQDWSDSDSLPNKTTMLKLLKFWWEMDSYLYPPKITILQCLYGQERCALVACLMLMYEQFQIYKEIDVFSSVFIVRKSIPAAIENYSQFNFLFEMAMLIYEDNIINK